MYHTNTTIRQGAKTDTDVKFFKTKLTHNWTGPYKVHLVPVPPLTPRTALLSALSSYVWIYPSTCPARMLAGAFRYNDASPVPTSTTMTTCRSIRERV